MTEIFQSYCRLLETRLASIEDHNEAIKIVSREIAPVLADPDFLLPHLEEMAAGKTMGELRAADYNDITIHRSPGGLFSVRLFVWEACAPYPIHDHGSWGVVGCLSGQISLTRFRRTDNATDPYTVELKESAHSTLQPGDTAAVYPLDQGIHRMEAYGGKTALSLHTYGRPIRKGYIRGFIPEKKQAYRIYAPKYLSRIIALKALYSLDYSGTEEIVEQFTREGSPILAEEAQSIMQARKEKGL